MNRLRQVRTEITRGSRAAHATRPCAGVAEDFRRCTTNVQSASAGGSTEEQSRGKRAHLVSTRRERGPEGRNGRETDSFGCRHRPAPQSDMDSHLSHQARRATGQMRSCSVDVWAAGQVGRDTVQSSALRQPERFAAQVDEVGPRRFAPNSPAAAGVGHFGGGP